ncbi:MAG: DUF2793 domain-containing protein, partial [Pseudomonadota bacterium]
MADTANLLLPLLDAAQAQKHVTMNEALARLDALSVRAVVSVGETQPPAPVDGQSFIVGAGATGDWAGHDGEIALALNGGWAFHAPRAGWRVFSEADHADYLCDAVTWQVQAIACSA